MEILPSLKRYQLEILFIFIIIFLVILYFVIPIVFIILGSISANLILIFNSIRKKKERIKKYAVVLNNIDDILRFVHAYQQGNYMNKTIYELFDNLENNFENELKDINCFFENIHGSRAFVIYINNDKIIAQPGRPIVREFKNRSQIYRLKDDEDIK